MGKGSRNRQLHMQELLESPQKKKKKAKKPAPKWLGSVIGLVLVVAILAGTIASIVTGSGIIKRNRIILESKTGEFDVNQQMATFLVWQELYSQSYTEWYYYYYKIYEDDLGILDRYSQNNGGADSYARDIAKYTIKEVLRDCMDDVMDMLKTYVAVCDAARNNNVTLSQADLEKINDSIKELKTMQTNFGYTSFNAFLKDCMTTGMKEKDIRAALQLQSLYNKYAAMKQDSFAQAVQLADLVTFRDANPDDYYKIDYLKYEAEDKAFADELKACTTEDDFKALILKKTFDDNYKASYNKFTTLAVAEKDLETITGKTDANGKTALTDALNTLNATTKTYNKKDAFTGETALKDWLFSSNRKQYNTGVVTVDNGVYLVALMSEPAAKDDENATVQARVKYYEFKAGDTHEGDDTFKNDIFTYISESKKDEPSYPAKPNYKKASEQATAFKATLEAEGANVEQLMQNADAETANGITASSSAVPSEVAAVATADDVKAGAILTANDDDVYYVVYVKAVNEEKGTSDIYYIAFEGDVYYQVINDLTETIDKVYPTQQSTNYDSDADEGTFAAWISQLSDKDTLTSARTHGDTNYFEVKNDKDNKDKVTGYAVYMVVNEPMYLDVTNVVRGGYLEFDANKTFAEDASNALTILKNETELDLLSALSAMDSSATVSYQLTESGISDAVLKAWFFSADRKKNDIEVVTAKDGKSAYVAIYVESLKSWEGAAKSNYVADQLQDWIDSMTKDYTPNEKALNQIGKPTPETSTTTTTETTAAQ